MKVKTIKIKDVTADEYVETLKETISEARDGDAVFVQYMGRGTSVQGTPTPPKEKQTLLRRYRWPLFILLWGAGQFAGTMFLYGQTKEAGVGFVIALGIICVAVVFEMIDEQHERDETGG